MIVAVNTFSGVKAQKFLNNSLLSSSIWIEIEVYGAVEAPGIYKVHPGENVKNLLKKVCLTDEANRRKIPFKKILLTSQVLEIPAKNRPVGATKKISLEEN